MASYDIFRRSIERAEAGWQILANDRGNYNSKKELVGTNYGVSAKFYEKVIGRPPSKEDMQAITQEEAHILFKNEFWDVMKADEIKSQAVAEMIVDHAINSNPRTTAGIVQRVLNKEFNKNLIVDKVVGIRTITAINSVDVKKLFNELALARLSYYRRLKDYKHFAPSWTSRVYNLAKDFGIEIKKKRN